MQTSTPDTRPPFCTVQKEWFNTLPTPCYVIDADRLKSNGEILLKVQRDTGCRILLAQKAFSNYDAYPILKPFLAGTEASGLFEARLGHEEFPEGEVHVFCGAYREEDIEELAEVSDHIVFNSPGQLKCFGRKLKSLGKSLGLRINPECSTQEGHDIYDPCSPLSRLGVTRTRFDSEMDEEAIQLLDGLHFHTLCEQNSDDLATTLDAVEKGFGDILKRMKWLNMGGGHHITRPDYDIALLEECILRMKNKYDLQIYLEPGEAVALNAGFLVSQVLDTFHSGEYDHAILDTSAACHMPDVLEMPYRPPIWGAGEKGESAHDVLLGGPTCLAGDSIGCFSFDTELSIGDRVLFGDMAIYTTCKNNTFNGMPLPDIYLMEKDSDSQPKFTKLTDFGYTDFKKRLGR